jgi:DNA-binding NarL/FixJ family response regulator
MDVRSVPGRSGNGPPSPDTRSPISMAGTAHAALPAANAGRAAADERAVLDIDGAVFCLVAASIDSPPVPRTPPARPEAADTARHTMLVAGEQPIVRRGLSALLGDAGFQRVHETTLAAAPAAVRERRPGLVLIAIPPSVDGGGQDPVRDVIRARPSTRVIALLGAPSVAAARRAIDAGAAGVVPPSVTGAALTSAVHDVAAGQRHVHPEFLAALVGQLQGINGSGGAERLTPRERDVTMLLAEGLTNASIATRLSVAESTIKTHVKHVLEKLGARDRAHAVAIAIRSGLIG